MPKCIAQLSADIAAVAPISGVSVGRWGDKATWRIMFADEATQQQRDDAQAVVTAFDYAALKAAEDARVTEIEADAGRVDLVARLRTATNAQIDTWIDANITSIAAARALFKAIIKYLAQQQR